MIHTCSFALLSPYHGGVTPISLQTNGALSLRLCICISLEMFIITNLSRRLMSTCEDLPPAVCVWTTSLQSLPSCVWIFNRRTLKPPSHFVKRHMESFFERALNTCMCSHFYDTFLDRAALRNRNRKKKIFSSINEQIVIDECTPSKFVQSIPIRFRVWSSAVQIN